MKLRTTLAQAISDLTLREIASLGIYLIIEAIQNQIYFMRFYKGTSISYLNSH